MPRSGLSLSAVMFWLEVSIKAQSTEKRRKQKMREITE